MYSTDCLTDGLTDGRTDSTAMDGHAENGQESEGWRGGVEDRMGEEGERGEREGEGRCRAGEGRHKREPESGRGAETGKL